MDRNAVELARITDVVARWKGYGHLDRRNYDFDSRARVRIWKGTDERYKQPTFVLISDLDEEDTGVSIISCSECLATNLRREFELDDNVVWLVHYPRHNFRADGSQETVDLVRYTWDGKHYTHPVWTRFQKELAGLLGLDLGMEGYRELPEYVIVDLFKARERLERLLQP